MSTCEDLRTIALALPGVEEVEHWGMPAFRTKRRIFITVRLREKKAMIHIPEEHQEILFAARPEAFEPLHWGKITRCLVDLRNVPTKELSALVREAWAYAGPAKLPISRAAAKIPARGPKKRN